MTARIRHDGEVYVAIRRQDGAWCWNVIAVTFLGLRWLKLAGRERTQGRALEVGLRMRHRFLGLPDDAEVERMAQADLKRMRAGLL